MYRHLLFYILIVSRGNSFKIDLIPKNGAPPSQRAYSSMTYSNKYNSLVLFGGYNDNSWFSELWEYSLNTETWKLIYPVSTSPSK